MLTQTFTETLSVIRCASCGIAFGITQDFERRRRNDHEGFTCPSGHSNVFSGKSESEHLKDLLKEKDESISYYQRRINNLHTQVAEKNHQIRAQKAAKTRIFNRVKNGVCPCCNRHFSNLQNHIKTNHPELLTEKQ